MRARTRASRLALAALLLAAGAGAAAAAGPGTLRGRATLSLPGLALADVQPVVIYLEPLDGRAPAPSASLRPTVHQRDARFAPRFLAVAAGQTVEMPNDDAIYHNVFSYSKPNDFDLGLYPAGQSRAVTLRHAGAVKLYCSIHESMTGAIFVAPSPWFAVLGADGRFAITDVPAGRYELATWSERLPTTRREIALRPGEALELDVPLVESAR
jgi:plastocyanin